MKSNIQVTLPFNPSYIRLSTPIFPDSDMSMYSEPGDIGGHLKFQRKIHNKRILVILTQIHGSDRVYFDQLNPVQWYLLVIRWLDNIVSWRWTQTKSFRAIFIAD